VALGSNSSERRRSTHRIDAPLNVVIDVNVGLCPLRTTTNPSATTLTCHRKREVMTTEKVDLTPEELEAATVEEIPDREAMSLIDANVAVPVNAAVAANVLTDDSVADADADQEGDIDQTNLL